MLNLCRMIGDLFAQPVYVASKRMLDATALRQEAIASNLANVETPNYKRVDLAPGFSAQLQQALASKNSADMARLQPQLAADPIAPSLRSDGNTVDLEGELTALSENMVAHALETQLITGNLLKLRLAITGRP